MNTADPIVAFRLGAAELLDFDQRLTNVDLIVAVLRSLHTLKGAGAMFRFDALAGGIRHCRSVSDRVCERLAPVTANVVAVILSAQGLWRALVDGDASAAATTLVRPEAAIAQGSKLPVVAATSLARDGWPLTFALPVDAIVNGTNLLILLDDLRELNPRFITVRSSTMPKEAIARGGAERVIGPDAIAREMLQATNR